WGLGVFMRSPLMPSPHNWRRYCFTRHRLFYLSEGLCKNPLQAFSGVLCVDEVYQGQLAFLFAVDPVAPDGDRLIGYQLIHGDVDAAVIV
ncbi:MAG: hypothetical protein M3R61_08585, partial [Chloroflexota bacterium]|nr:hypothetical protein [Chloroflexota bacterium]